MRTRTEAEKAIFLETVNILMALHTDDLLKTWGFALGLKVKEESKNKGA